MHYVTENRKFSTSGCFQISPGCFLSICSHFYPVNAKSSCSDFSHAGVVREVEIENFQSLTFFE